MTPVLRGMLLDIAPPLVAYYGLRAAGVSEYLALLTATLLAGAKVGYDAVRARRLDPFAGYLMLNFGLSLAVGLATSDARMLMVGDTLVGGIGALIFLGSCVIGKPLTQVVAERVQPDDAPESVDAGAAAFRRHIHVLLSAIWGVGLLVGAGLSLCVIYSFSVDVGKGLNTALSLIVIAVLTLLTVVIAKRARARWQHTNGSAVPPPIPRHRGVRPQRSDHAPGTTRDRPGLSASESTLEV